MYNLEIDMEGARLVGRWLLLITHILLNSAAFLYFVSICTRPNLDRGDRVLYAILFLAAWAFFNAFALALVIP